MRKSTEILALSEILFFYGFILKSTNPFFKVLFYIFLAASVVFIVLSKKRFYCLAGICAGLFALSGFYTENARIKTLLPLSKATELYCQIIASPERLNDAYYSIKVKVISLNSENIACSADGTATVIIKTTELQNSLPGKIFKRRGYSENCTRLIDKGLFIFFSGSFKDGAVFSADSVFENEFCYYKSRIYEMRALARYRLKHILLSFAGAGRLLSALTIGSRDYLDTSMQILFRKAGLSHILALSGFHLSVVCAFAQKTADFFKKKRRCLFLVIVSAVFVFLAGSQASLVRALIFTCINCLCSFFYIKCRKEAVFYLSLCIHLIVQPAAAFTPSFLLSYSAIFGIIFFSPKIRNYLCGSFPKKAEKIKELFSVSAGAQLGAVPVQFFMLHSFSLKGIISSIVAVPLVSVFVILGIFAILFSLVFPESAAVFRAVLTFIYNIIVLSVHFFSRL